MIRRPPRSTPLYSSAASDVYKRQTLVRSLIKRHNYWRRLNRGLQVAGINVVVRDAVRESVVHPVHAASLALVRRRSLRPSSRTLSAVSASAAVGRHASTPNSLSPPWSCWRKPLRRKPRCRLQRITSSSSSSSGGASLAGHGRLHEFSPLGTVLRTLPRRVEAEIVLLEVELNRSNRI